MSIDGKAAVELYVDGYPLEDCAAEIVEVTGLGSTLVPGDASLNTFGAASRRVGPRASFDGFDCFARRCR